MLTLAIMMRMALSVLNLYKAVVVGGPQVLYW